MPDEMLRTFIAIELSEPLAAAIGRVQAQLKRGMPPRGVKWAATEGIHLTLKFLGETPRSRIPEIVAALKVVCAGFPAFEFTVEGRGCFPNFRRPRVIWVAVREPSQTLGRVQAAIEEQIAALGWPTEARPFSPHLTLGRVARSAYRPTEAAIGQAVERAVVERIGVQRVTAVSLVQSDLRPTGAVYTVLARAMLAAQPS